MSQVKNKKQIKRKKEKAVWPMALIVIGGIILVLGGLYIYSQLPQPKAEIEVTGAPSLSVDQEEIDLGDVKLGEPVRVTFELTNVGDQPLRFDSAPTVEVLNGG